MSEVNTKSGTVHLALEQETAGSVRYKEVNADGTLKQHAHCVTGTLYVRKSFLEKLCGKSYPDRLQLTVNW